MPATGTIGLLAQVAQLVEHFHGKEGVTSSSLVLGFVRTPRRCDDRLDHLNRRIEEGFARVDARFDEMSKRFDRMEDRYDQTNERIFATQRIMIAASGGMIAAFAAGLLTVIATQL